MRSGQAPLEKLHFALAGEHQVHNLRCILQAGLMLEQLGMPIPDAAWLEGLAGVQQRTGFRGRWDVLQEKPWLIVDGAHNREGLRAMRRLLEQVPRKKLHVVTASVKDKDLDSVMCPADWMPCRCRKPLPDSATPGRSTQRYNKPSTALCKQRSPKMLCWSAEACLRWPRCLCRCPVDACSPDSLLAFPLAEPKAYSSLSPST
jgi:hypothetical protein